MSRVRSDIGRYAIVPEWVLVSGVSSRAVHLFAILACKYSDRAHTSYPSRKTLAKDLGVTNERTVDRAIKDLERIGALCVERNRKTEEGDYDTNLYKLTLVSPGGVKQVPTGTGIRVPTGGDTSVTLTRPIKNQTNPNQGTSFVDTKEVPVTPPSKNTYRPSPTKNGRGQRWTGRESNQDKYARFQAQVEAEKAANAVD